MMMVSGLEMFTMEARSVTHALGSSSGIKLITTGVTLSIVSLEKICCRVAVENSLMVLAISWMVPSAVSCRLAVMFTSLGRLKRAATVSASLTKPSGGIWGRTKAGGSTPKATVTSTETVALYPSACCCMAARRRGRKRMYATTHGEVTLPVAEAVSWTVAGQGC